MLALAWRNLWRQRRRSATTAGAVAVVVAFAIVYYGIGGAMVNSMYSELTATSGQVQVHARDYRDVRDFGQSLVRDAADVRDQIVAHARGGEVVGVLDVPGLLIHGDRSRAIAMRGSDWPARVRQEFLLRNRLSGTFVAGTGAGADLRSATGSDTGSDTRSDTGSDGGNATRSGAEGQDGAGTTTGAAGTADTVVLGRALARALGVTVGDEVALYAPGTEGFGAAALTVTGVLDMADPGAEARTALIPLATAQEIAAPDAVTHFEIHYPDVRRLDQDEISSEVAAALGRTLPALSVESWRELAPDLVRLVHAIGPMLAVITSIFFVLAGLLVVNTVYLGLIERIREFGVLMSLGASGRRVMAMITLESVLLCVTGAAVGLLVGLGSVAVLSRGFSFPGFDAYFAGLGMDPRLYASVAPGQVVLAVGFALAVGVLAALWPAGVASRLEPVEAMRFTA